MHSKNLIKEIVATAATPQFKRAGYKKAGYTWRKPTEELTRVANIQLSSGNTYASSRFTLNLGVCHLGFREFLGLGEPSKAIKESDCRPRLRIGALMNAGDFWWEVTSDSDVQTVAEAVGQKIRDLALPWLESLSNLHDIHTASVDRRDFYNAGVTGTMLGLDSVPDLMRQAVETIRPDNARYADSIVEWCRERGIEI
ncbi:MAG: DUF4304 domain-containing protein [Acidobacteriota bacterium]